MSKNGPVAGGAFMDPPMTSVYDIGWLGGDYTSLLTPIIPDPSIDGTSCTPEPECYSVPPMSDFRAGTWTAYGGVPEPSTWAMMLLGFGGLAYAGYRRTRAIAAHP
jgi:PEP-CTERM motif